MNPDSLITAASFTPNSLQFPNAWVGHLPFAAWVIREISPKIFVELGTHSGNSYFSFCQSVVEAGVSTKCYAVDTWQGDEHAGQYNNEVFAKVNAYHQEHYSEFSRLLRMTFDDAISYFSDESIELLHIDGLHTYEAVRHDFETWLPKLVPGAIVMFHDTNVRENDFGVWKLWEELQADFPNNLEFLHSHGLGVLQLNNAQDDKKPEWLHPGSPEKQRMINYFAALGSRQLERLEFSELKQHTSNLNQAVYERDVQIASLKQSVADCESRITISKQSLLERKSRINNLNQALIEAHRFVELTHSLEEKLRCSELKITEILASTSWKASEPLRALSRLFRKLSRAIVVPLEVEGAAQQIVERGSALIASGFDAEFYSKAYPDICGCDLFAHYSEYGKNEGRLPCAPDLITNYDLKTLDRSKETVLIVSHEASRTGAPILALNIAQHLKGKYNVIAFLLGGGGLLTDFQECCDIVVEPFPQAHNPFITSTVLTKLISQVDLKFAIVNSIVSKPVLSPLANHFVPSLCLVHEFASYTYPKNTIREVLLWASQVVFSARIVYENNAAQCVELKGACPVILPQGKCEVPYSKDNERLDENQSQRIRKMFRPDSLPDNTVVILGAGFVHIRKGVDLFLACAARVVGLHPKNTFRFVWVGHGFDPDLDMGYSVYLQDQIIRSGLENHVCFTGELSDIDMAYELSDVLFLSSRLDPLPNVAIDAMSKQLPVICFDNTTGIADLLKENGLGEACVIPYLDIELAAQRLVALIENSDQRNRLGKEIKEVGEKLFDMRSYVDSLERQVLDCVVMQETEKSDCTYIENDGALDLDFYLPPSWSALSDREAVRAFVRSWKSGIDMRKPFPGFHPGIYADCHGLSQTGKNPLAAFIEAGKTEGPWLYDLIPPSSHVQMRNKLPLRAALHIHVFFVDLFLDILRRLEGQDFQLDLLISVPSLEVAEEVSFMVSGYTNGTVDIRTVPNRGRDIGPLLTEFNETILKDYDVIGHVHTKKSGDVKDAAMGQSWLNFLLENLIGRRYPMASTILERMAGDKQLGLVFPDDPWVVGWSGNKEIAEDLAHQFGINELPDHHFNFPVGTMFWARTEALKPLLTKGFRWEDFPEEPLPYDGTLLHALERLLPFVAKKTGYHVAMTHVSGITR